MACELHAVTKLSGPKQVPIHLKILQNLEKVCASILQFYCLVASNLPGHQVAGRGGKRKHGGSCTLHHLNLEVMIISSAYMPLARINHMIPSQMQHAGVLVNVVQLGSHSQAPILHHKRYG